MLGRSLPFERAAAVAAPSSAPPPDIEESFEFSEGWPGTADEPAPVWGAAGIDESYEAAEGWPV
jgi:hypothetical protein